jgi:hypothetical protein
MAERQAASPKTLTSLNHYQTNATTKHIDKNQQFAHRFEAIVSTSKRIDTKKNNAKSYKAHVTCVSLVYHYHHHYCYYFHVMLKK